MDDGTPKTYAECWTTNKGAMGRPDPSVCHKRSIMRTMEFQPIGDNWVDAVMRRKYVDVHARVQREMKRREALVLSGGEMDSQGLVEDVHELFRYKDDGTVDVQMGRCRSMGFLPWIG